MDIAVDEFPLKVTFVSVGLKRNPWPSTDPSSYVVNPMPVLPLKVTLVNVALPSSTWTPSPVLPMKMPSVSIMFPCN